MKKTLTIETQDLNPRAWEFLRPGRLSAETSILFVWKPTGAPFKPEVTNSQRTVASGFSMPRAHRSPMGRGLFNRFVSVVSMIQDAPARRFSATPKFSLGGSLQ